VLRLRAIVCEILSDLKINCIFAGVMQRFFIKTGHRIQRMIDFSYPPFRKWIPPQLYRYGVCGSANVAFDWGLYFFVYNFILQHRDADLRIVTLSPHIASLILIFPVITFSGFFLQKYVTFTASDLRGSIQLMRYLMVVLANLLINYAGLKVFVDGLGFYPTPSKMIITVISVVCSYIGQKRFTFTSSSPVGKIPGNDGKLPPE
jgi:putative flippase GtrA